MNIETKVLNYLRRYSSATNRKTADQISRFVFRKGSLESNKKAVINAVKRLRDELYPIASRSHGYFIAKTADGMKPTITLLKNKKKGILNSLRAINAMKF